MDGGEPATLFRNPEAGFVQPCAWSADGKQILTLLFRKDNVSQIALVDSAAAGKFRVLKTLDWVYPNKMDLSPDGGYVIYDNPAADDGVERDIFALSVDGSRETRLVAGPSHDIFPVWTPDGASVVFASDRGGRFGIWRQAIREGKPAGEPVALKSDAGRVLSLGMTAQGRYVYGARSGATDVQVTTLDLAAGTLAAQPQPAVVGLAGLTSAPAWSADGRRLALLVRLANENFGQESRGIGIADAGGAAGVQVLTPKLAHIQRIEWAPDGKSVLASGSDRQNRRGLYRIDAANGDISPVVQQRSSTYRGLDGVWGAAGQSILYADDSGAGAEIRERRLSDSVETTLYRAGPGIGVSHLALSPGARRLAFVAGTGEPGSRDEVRVLELKPGQARTIASLPHGGVLGLEWMPDSTAVLISTTGNPAALWRTPLDGGQPQRLEVRLERRDGIRLHPDGRRIAFTTGQTHSEVWVLDLPASGPPRESRP
jgi:Tol biopolymer transport system component